MHICIIATFTCQRLWVLVLIFRSASRIGIPPRDALAESRELWNWTICPRPLLDFVSPSQDPQNEGETSFITVLDSDLTNFYPFGVAMWASSIMLPPVSWRYSKSWLLKWACLANPTRMGYWHLFSTPKMMPNLMMLHISRVGTYWWWKHPIVSRFPTLGLIIGGGLYGYIFSPQVFRKKKQLPFPSQARPSAAILDAPTESGQRGGAVTNRLTLFCPTEWARVMGHLTV